MIDLPELLKGQSEAQSDASFWTVAEQISALKDAERIQIIRAGLPAMMIALVGTALAVNRSTIGTMLNLSPSTAERRFKDGKPLDPVASERVDRLLQVALLARDVFEDDKIAAKWLAIPNDALGGEPPFALCDTDLGARQVRRVLHAIEWGNAA
ncbi:MAG TPA: DUF2384 domain-containing protein [Pseudomonas xinjiangensis]|uniref:DUF2384 domain-containing protein n=3 Tax=root TaxID=1 RepID=A0A7V1BL88_9GAMM|nr:DUF2384 domain-containing protein [Halopseudomonas xinjiangensis]HEA51685.1 DUF2384 domain-containing protein [Marinobacter antarcticus]